MPWQQMVADVGLEIDPDTGLLAYRKVGITIPRQNGKTTIMLSWECERALMWGQPYTIVYSAQTGGDARKKLLNDQVPLIQDSPLGQLVTKVQMANDNTAVVWANRSRIEPIPNTPTAGHGKTIGLAVMDELFADTDETREQAVAPAMITVRNAQRLWASTAGTETSVALDKAVAQGRLAVDRDSRSGTAYFEWSAQPDEDPDDPETWWRCMPALGITIDESSVRHERSELTDSEFRRAFLNIPTTSNERVIPAGAWEAVCGDDVAPDGALRFAVCVTPEHGAASIVVADSLGRCELVAARPGLAWVVDALDALWNRHRTPVALDAYGPTGSLVADLERAGVPFEPISTSDMRAACGGLLDAIYAESISVRRSQQLDDAIAAARKRSSGDAFVWSMSATGADTSPLVALTIAHSMARQTSEPALWAY